MFLFSTLYIRTFTKRHLGSLGSLFILLFFCTFSDATLFPLHITVGYNLINLLKTFCIEDISVNLVYLKILTFKVSLMKHVPPIYLFCFILRSIPNTGLRCVILLLFLNKLEVYRQVIAKCKH